MSIVIDRKAGIVNDSRFTDGCDGHETFFRLFRKTQSVKRAVVIRVDNMNPTVPGLGDRG